MICRFAKIVITLIFALTVHGANAQETDQAEVDTIVEPTESDTSSINYYKPDSVVLRNVPDSVVQRLQGEKAFAYANDPQFWVKEESQDSKTIFDYLVDFFGSTAVKTILYFLAIGAIVFIIFRLIMTNNLLFYSSRKKHPDEEAFLEQEVDPDNIDSKINEAVTAGNYRLAVRFLYLKTLFRLNDAGLISYHTQATNHDYLTELSGNRLGKEFKFLTQVYEYVWYGEFQVNAEQFTTVNERFSIFHEEIK